MAPRLYSRHQFTNGVRDGEDAPLYLTEREPFGYVALGDNLAHTVGAGDTLQNLAARYFRGLANPAQLWWVIADFQPEPIVDPTIKLEDGSVLVVPSVATVVARIFAEERRQAEPG